MSRWAHTVYIYIYLLEISTPTLYNEIINTDSYAVLCSRRRPNNPPNHQPNHRPNHRPTDRTTEPPNHQTTDRPTDRRRDAGRGKSGNGQSLSMWLSSTEPDIALWGGEAGGGEALRRGRSEASPAAGKFDASRYPDARQGGLGLDEGGCLLNGPVGVIRGQPGVVRHAVLNNRCVHTSTVVVVQF